MRFADAEVRSVIAAGLLVLVWSQTARAEHAYVPNEGSGTISVIDVASDAQTSYSPIPKQGSLGEKIRGLAIARDGGTLYLIDARGNTVQALDPVTGAVRKTIADVRSAEGIQLSPDGTMLAVCAEASNEAVLIDAASFTIVTRITVAGNNPEHCVWSRDGRWLLTSNEESHDIDVLDVAARKPAHLIKLSGAPRGMSFSLDGKTLYVANEGAGTLDIIGAGGDWPLLKSVPTALRPAGVTVGAKGDRVYVSNGGAGTVSVVDTKRREVIASIDIGKRPWNMALSRDGSKLYVAAGRSDEVDVIDTAANKVLKVIPVGHLPWGVAVD